MKLPEPPEVNNSQGIAPMRLMKDFLTTIRNGGDAAVAAVQRMGDDCRAQLEQAANEVEGLRLTDEERQAISWVCGDVADITGPTEDTLRGLLERHFPASGNGGKNETTPESHSNHSEGSVRPECATSPPWLARPFWVDPPSGYRYGFPRLYDPAKDGDVTQWMVANGYPQHLADQNLPCTFTACTDSQ